MPRFNPRPWDATKLAPGDVVYLVATGNRARFYAREPSTGPVVAHVAEVKRVYAYLQTPNSRNLLKMRREDGVVPDDGLSGWLTFPTRGDIDVEMRRRRQVVEIRHAMSVNAVDELSAESVAKIHEILKTENKINPAE